MAGDYDKPTGPPDVAPFSLVQINEMYLSYLIGFAEELAEAGIFDDATESENAEARQWFAQLAVILADEYVCP